MHLRSTTFTQVLETSSTLADEKGEDPRIVVNEKKIRRIQKKFGLFALRMRKFIRTTDSNHRFAVYPNLLRPGIQVEALNQVWVADITYIRIQTGFVFLAAIMDLCSRKVVGWAISKRIDRDLALGALRMALEIRRPPRGCIHHSDRSVLEPLRDLRRGSGAGRMST